MSNNSEKTSVIDENDDENENLDIEIVDKTPVDTEVQIGNLDYHDEDEDDVENESRVEDRNNTSNMVTMNNNNPVRKNLMNKIKNTNQVTEFSQGNTRNYNNNLNPIHQNTNDKQNSSFDNNKNQYSNYNTNLHESKVQEFKEMNKKLQNKVIDNNIRKYNNKNINDTNKNYTYKEPSAMYNMTEGNMNTNYQLTKSHHNTNALNTETGEKINSLAGVEKSNILYNMHKDKLNKKERKIEEANIIKEEKELLECTFMPDTSLLKAQVNKDEVGSLYERNLVWKNNLQTRIDQEKNSQMQKADNDYSFKPNISKNRNYNFEAVDERVLQDTMKYKDRLMLVEQRKKEDKMRVRPNYEKKYDQKHKYDKNIDVYLHKMGVKTEIPEDNNEYNNSSMPPKNEGNDENNVNNTENNFAGTFGVGNNKEITNFNNVDMDVVIMTLRNELREADLELII